MSSDQAVSAAGSHPLEARSSSLERQRNAGEIDQLTNCMQEFDLSLKRQEQQLRKLESSVHTLYQIVSSLQDVQTGLSKVGRNTCSEHAGGLGDVESIQNVQTCSNQTFSGHTGVLGDVELTSLATRNHTSIGHDIHSERGVDTGLAKPSLERALQANIWESALLVNLRPVDFQKSCILVLGLTANIVIQGLFCIFIGMNFLHSKLPDPTEIRRWRLVDAHDSKYLDVGTGSSLVSRVCGNDASLSVGAAQMKLVEEIEKYITNNAGVTLFLLSLSVWFLKLAKEARETYSFLITLMGIPKGSLASLIADGSSSRGTVTGLNSEMNYGIWQISAGRFFSMLFSCLVRLIIIISLMFIGTFWLADTKNIEDLILNALALAFLIEVPELIFDVFVDERTKNILDAIHPLPYPVQIFKIPILSLRKLLLVVLLTVFVVVCTASLNFWVLPQLQTMKELQIEACGGYRDFVVGPQFHTGLVMHANSTSPSGLEQGHITLAQRSVASLIKKASTSFAVSTRSTSDFYYHQHLLMTDIVEGWFFMSCQDIAPSRKDEEDYEDLYDYLPIIWALREQTEIWHGGVCSDFAAACGKHGARLLRLACPGTCGCDNPLSGLVLNTKEFGCQYDICHTGFWNQFTSQRFCADLDLGTLSKHPGWQRYVHELGFYGESVLFVKAHFRETFFTDLQKNLQQSGCKVLHVLPKLDLDLFCSGHMFASVRAFCPVACRCHIPSHFGPACPESCIDSNTNPQLLIARK